MSLVRPTRQTLLAAASALVGVPYLWGGKGPRGLDCSGLVTLALSAAGGPDWRRTHNSDRLWAELPPVAIPEAGDLAFYGPVGDPMHVVICLGGPDALVLGANGGGRQTVSVEAADRIGARVRFASRPTYRPDLLGYRTIEPLLWRPTA